MSTPGSPNQPQGWGPTETSTPEGGWGAGPPPGPRGGGNDNSTAALVLGIISLASIILAFLGLLGIIAIVLGVRTRTALGEGHPNRGKATTGLVLGIIGLLVGIANGIIGAALVLSG